MAGDVVVVFLSILFKLDVLIASGNGSRGLGDFLSDEGDIFIIILRCDSSVLRTTSDIETFLPLRREWKTEVFAGGEGTILTLRINVPPPITYRPGITFCMKRAMTNTTFRSKMAGGTTGIAVDWNVSYKFCGFKHAGFEASPYKVAG